jgi:FkbM family methyltransferase
MTPAASTGPRLNFDDALKRYLPQVWFRLKFIKYKYLGRGEPELRLIRHFVEPGTTAVDVGASIGMYATELARYAARVLAFEANPAVAAFARSVAPRSVEVINAALSREAGRATLRMPRNRKGQGVTELASIVPNAAYPDDAIALEVETRRLDDFAIDDCSFIKIDVEGHEEAVLDGAAALIAAQRPVLMIELVEAFNPGVVVRLSAHYARLSYDCLFLAQGALRPVAEFDAARHQAANNHKYVANFLFVPAERKERLRAAVANGRITGR